MKLYYIENSVNEFRNRIMGYFSTLEKAQEALVDCEDWYRSKGTGKIYQVDLDTLNPNPVLVCKDGVLIDQELQTQKELYTLMKPPFIRFAAKSYDTFLTLANFCSYLIQNEPNYGLMKFLEEHDIMLSSNEFKECFMNVATEYKSIKERMAQTFNLNALVVDDKGRRGRVVEFEPQNKTYHVLFIDPENVSADGWYPPERLKHYEPKEKISAKEGLDSLIAAAQSISEQSAQLTSNLQRHKESLDLEH